MASSTSFLRSAGNRPARIESLQHPDGRVGRRAVEILVLEPLVHGLLRRCDRNAPDTLPPDIAIDGLGSSRCGQQNVARIVVADDQCVADQVADRQSASLRNGIPQRTVRVPRQPALPEGEETVRRQAGPARGVQHGQRLIEFEDAHRGQLGFLLDTGDHPAVVQYGDGYRRLPVPEESPDAFFERAVAGGHVCCGERQTAQTDDSLYGVGYHMIRIFTVRLQRPFSARAAGLAIARAGKGMLAARRGREL